MPNVEKEWLDDAAFAMEVIDEMMVAYRRSGNLVGVLPNVNGPDIVARNKIADAMGEARR